MCKPPAHAELLAAPKLSDPAFIHLLLMPLVLMLPHDAGSRHLLGHVRTLRVAVLSPLPSEHDL